MSTDHTQRHHTRALSTVNHTFSLTLLSTMTSSIDREISRTTITTGPPTHSVGGGGRGQTGNGRGRLSSSVTLYGGPAGGGQAMPPSV